MVVIYGRPPILDRVIAQLGTSVIAAYFTWDGQIYSPSGTTPPDEIVEHEKVHKVQHEAFGGSGPWWDRWLGDPAFRLDQEVRAYATQYAWLRTRDKGNARAQLEWFAHVLSGNGYGGLTDKVGARQAILMRAMALRG